MTILIKKYKNRRLYDTDKSIYITIDMLQSYVMNGVAFKVEDSSTGRDLTNATLLQLLVDIESGPTQFLSTELLTQLIKLSHHPMHVTMKSTLENFFTTLEINNGEKIKSVSQPFFWVHGEADDFLNINTHGAVVYNKYQGSYKEAHRIAGAGHSTVPQTMVFVNYMNALGDFIEGL